MATNNAVDVGLSGATGTGNFVGSTSPSITTPKIITQINDTNGNPVIGITATGSAVNYVNVTNEATTLAPAMAAVGTDTNISYNFSSKGTGSIGLYGFNFGNAIALFNSTASAVNYIELGNNTTGNAPTISAIGSDTNVALSFIGQGTGGVTFQGTGTNNNATAGNIGEFISSTILSGSAVTATSNASVNVTSISLTAGDWQVWGNVSWPTLGTTPTSVVAWISTVSATAPDAALRSDINLVTGVLGINTGLATPTVRISIAATTTVYLSGFLGNTSGNGTVCGGIFARRMR